MLVNILCLSVCLLVLGDAALIEKMEPVDYSQVPIEEIPLHEPTLEEVADGEINNDDLDGRVVTMPDCHPIPVRVLSRGLKNNFASVAVSAENSPDLTQPPYNLTTPGLAGKANLVELGGPRYLVPEVQKEKVYELPLLLKHLKRPNAYLGGAGAGPWPYLGVNCESIINLRVSDGEIYQGTRVVSVTPVGAAKGEGQILQQILPANETRAALLGNCLVTDGVPGKVIKVVAKNRTGSDNFITAIRETLRNHYGEKVIGLGGTFLLREGEAKYHVMPDFSPTGLHSDSDVDEWLHYFDVKAPIVHLGTILTGDLDQNLRAQHFHGFSGTGEGGHYHYDTTPEDVHYEGYFTLAESVVLVDRPAHTHVDWE